MADESLRNHGNHVEVNYGTIHQYLGHQLPRKPLRELSRLKRVALLAGGLATALLGAWGFHAQGSVHKVGRVYYCASGGHVKYHTSASCKGLSSCSARVISITMFRVEKQHMEPCQLCH
jgi:hypothetical protein